MPAVNVVCATFERMPDTGSQVKTAPAAATQLYLVGCRARQVLKCTKNCVALCRSGKLTCFHVSKNTSPAGQDSVSWASWLLWPSLLPLGVDVDVVLSAQLTECMLPGVANCCFTCCDPPAAAASAVTTGLSLSAATCNLKYTACLPCRLLKHIISPMPCSAGPPLCWHCNCAYQL